MIDAWPILGQHGATLASLVVGPIQLDEPRWLWAFPPLAALACWIALVNLSGLGRATRWTALAVRLIVIALLALALAQPNWRRVSKDVAVVFVLDASQSVPGKLQRAVEKFAGDSRAQAAERRPGDRLGSITVAKGGYVQDLPLPLTASIEHQHKGPLDQSNLAAGINLALAIKPTDAAYRLVLASDGLETTGSLLQAAQAAKALKVPIDVIPLRFKHDAEVILDRVVVPSNARENETITIRVVLNATKAARGRLALLVDGKPLNLGGEGGASAPIELEAGTNVRQFSVPAMARGALKFEPVFIPDPGSGGDTIAENNRSSAVTFVSGEGRVLVLSSDPRASEALERVLRESSLKADVRTPADGPQTLADFNAYDLVLVVNEPADHFSLKQQEDLKRYVYDSGGGLAMIGGDQSFGAGGWIGSPIEDALPIRLDPPQKREMPKGALALVVHSIEMPEGVYWGKRTAEAAVDALSRLDLVGINEFTGGMGGTAGVEWVYPLSPVGDKSRVKRAINNLTFGDMPDFSPSLEMAYDALVRAKDAGQKHVIMISDGDPSAPSSSLLDKYNDAGITISTVGVFPHNSGNTGSLEWIAKYTKGTYYYVNDQAGLATIPQIFIKEARTVRRSLIWEGEAFTPTLVPGAAEALRGVSAVPPIRGYVVTAEREGLALTTMKGREGDPILAQWQHGLGKVVAYTSDAAAKWNPDWIAWSGFKAFWEQHIRWAMRPTGNANLRVSTQAKGDSTIIHVDALDAQGEHLNFARFRGRVSFADGTSADVDLKQIGPGRYEAELGSTPPGSSVVSLRYAAPDPQAKEGVIEGSVQAAINRPFTDEYRSLEDNAPLLEQVAAMTGGRVLGTDPGKAELWRREGLTFPAPTTPIWLAVAVGAIGIFLADVGVRRVRIEPAMIAGFVRRMLGRGKVKAGEQMDALRAAREQARQKIAQRELSAAERAAQKAMDQDQAERAKVKFEASAEQLKKPAAPVALGGADAKPAETRPGIKDAPKTETKPGESMSRLMQAKKKAREDMTE